MIIFGDFLVPEVTVLGFQVLLSENLNKTVCIYVAKLSSACAPLHP